MQLLGSVEASESARIPAEEGAQKELSPLSTNRFAPGPWEALAAAAAAAPPTAWLHGLDNHPASAGMVNLGFVHALPAAAPFLRDAAARWAAELAASPEAGREVCASCWTSAGCTPT